MSTDHAPPAASVPHALNGIAHRQNQELFASLTSRERELMASVIAGKGDKAIADELRISLATVRTHLENIRRKLHVSNRAGAAAMFVFHALFQQCDSATRKAIERLLSIGEAAETQPSENSRSQHHPLHAPTRDAAREKKKEAFIQKGAMASWFALPILALHWIGLGELFATSNLQPPMEVRPLPGFSARGIARTEKPDDDGERVLILKSEFSFSVSNGWWQVEQRFLYPPELQGNAENCRRIPDGVRLNPFLKSERKGMLPTEAYPFSFPPPDRPGNFVCWLMLCPRPDLPLLDSVRMRRLKSFAFMKNPQNEGPYALAFLEPDSIFISKLSIEDGGLLYAAGGRLHSYVPPLEHGIVEDQFELLATTNAFGQTYPLRAVWRHFRLKPGAKSAKEVQVTTETHVLVTSIDPSPDFKGLSTPEKEYYALDFRFPKLEANQRIGHVVTNDHWRSVTNREMRSLAAAWAWPHHANKGSGLSVVLVLALFALPIPVIWALVRLKKRRKT